MGKNKTAKTPITESELLDKVDTINMLNANEGKPNKPKLSGGRTNSGEPMKDSSINSGEKLRGNKDVASKQPRRVGASPTPATSDDATLAILDEWAKTIRSDATWLEIVLKADRDENLFGTIEEIVRFAIARTSSIKDKEWAAAMLRDVKLFSEQASRKAAEEIFKKLEREEWVAVGYDTPNDKMWERFKRKWVR